MVWRGVGETSVCNGYFAVEAASPNACRALTKSVMGPTLSAIRSSAFSATDANSDTSVILIQCGEQMRRERVRSVRKQCGSVLRILRTPHSAFSATDAESDTSVIRIQCGEQNVERIERTERAEAV